MDMEFNRGRAAMAQELVDLLENSAYNEAELNKKLTEPPKNFSI